jgi:hypothetical protein
MTAPTRVWQGLEKTRDRIRRTHKQCGVRLEPEEDGIEDDERQDEVARAVARCDALTPGSHTVIDSRGSGGREAT